MEPNGETPTPGKGTSVSEISLPPLTENTTALKGCYLGHDEFAVVDNILSHRFSVYPSTDTNAKATSGTR